MEDSFYLSECGDDDVLSFEDTTFKVSKFRKAVDKSFDSDLGSTLSSRLNNAGIYIAEKILKPTNDCQEYERWFKNGIDCEILNLGSKSWKKGKVRIKISVEFYVEEQEVVETPSSDKLENSQPESPLEDIRRMINQDSQQKHS